LYETIIVKLIFDLFHLLVRPAGDYLVVPTWLWLAAARRDGQGWP